MRGGDRSGLALVGLGGNLGPVAVIKERFHRAADALRSHLPVVDIAWSRVYLSQPLGPVSDQPAFVNAALAVYLSGPVLPANILACLLDIEARLGRVRDRPKGPRTIDLDLLFVDGHDRLTLAGPPRLSLPHPGAMQRAFVLRPLADLLGPDWRMPGIGRTIAECLLDPDVAAQVVTEVVTELETTTDPA